MKIANRLGWGLITLCILFSFQSCEKDEGKLPEIEFKTGADYLSSNSTLTAGSSFKTGITAKKAEEKDPLIKFNISKATDGGTSTEVYNKTLSGTEGDSFSYDYSGTADGSAGQKLTYTFTITNRDGLVAQKSLTITLQ